MNKRLTGNFYDTGGPGAIPTARGEADKWWVPCQYTTVPRLMMATRLAMGPATIEDLSNLTHASYCGTYQIVRNWIGSRFAEWTMHLPADPMHGATFRIVTLAERGRKDLWRFGWVTRRLKFAEHQDVPLRADVPDDPLEALRLHARHEFLRPAAMAILFELLNWPKMHIDELGRHVRDYTAARRYIKIFRNAGFVTGVDDPYPETWRRSAPRWLISDYGHYCLDRHIDALRRAALASGYQPTRDCELYYPGEQESPCAHSIRPHSPPQCPDCPYWWLADDGE